MERSDRKKSKPIQTETDGFQFEDTDKVDGRIVYLPPGRWENKILRDHPEMSGYEERVKETALDPDLICYEENAVQEEVRAVFDKSRGLYVWVPIKLVEFDKWRVKSAYFVREIR